MTSSLGHLPPSGARWAFDESVAACFDDMLERSIPQHAEMRRLVTALGLRYVRANSDVLDLGCSRGDALAPFIERAADARSFVGVEISPPMLAAAAERFRDVPPPRVQLLSLDLRSAFPVAVPSLVLSVLTLQFVPIEYRQRIVRAVFEALLPGGAFILVEKILGADGVLDAVLVDEYLALKVASGYTPEEIARKRLALEGALVPITAEWNESMLRHAGFAHVDCFWRWCNFAGWIALKAARHDG